MMIVMTMVVMLWFMTIFVIKVKGMRIEKQ